MNHAITICYHWSLIVLILNSAMTTWYHWSLMMLILDCAMTTCNHWSPMMPVSDRTITCYHWFLTLLILGHARIIIYILPLINNYAIWGPSNDYMLPFTSNIVDYGQCWSLSIPCRFVDLMNWTHIVISLILLFWCWCCFW